MSPSLRLRHHEDHELDDEHDELTEALEITPSSSPSSNPSRLLETTTEEQDGKAYEVFTETELMLPHPHLQLSLIRSSCKKDKSSSSPSSVDPSETSFSAQHTGLEKTSSQVDDDDESVGYFDINDFNSSYWMKAVSNVPTLSLAAIITTGFAIMHPWIFVLGALTAVGTAHAVGVKYDWITSSSSESSPPTSIEIEKTEVAPPPTELLCRSFSPGNMTSASSIPTDQWLRKYFPDLEYSVVDNQEFPGLSASEFFQVFFSDDAPYSFMEFQKKRGDEDICYGAWREATSLSLEPQALSLVSQAALLEGDDVPSVETFQQRILTFKTMTKSFFGPPFAIATKRQVVVRRSKRCVVIESMTTLSQIPFCDRFHVVERWTIQSEKKGQPSRHVAHLQVNAQVVFTAKCPFENQIRSKSAATLSEVCKAWCAMAQEALLLTERAKRERLQRQDHEDLSCCTSMSYVKDGDLEASRMPMQREREDHESSIEVPYSQVYHDDRYPDDTFNSKRDAFGAISPRFFLTRCKRGMWIRNHRQTSTASL
jgi:hypothetical protein